MSDSTAQVTAPASPVPSASDASFPAGEATGSAAPDGASESAGPRGLSRRALDRLYAFRVTYVAIFVFILLYVFSVKGVEQLLQNHFSGEVQRAVQITDFTIPVTMQIQSRIDRRIAKSRWIRWGGVQATVIVLAADGRTWLYVGGRTVQPPESLDPTDAAREAVRLLPANDEVIVSVPHNALLANGILVFYATLLLSGLFFYNRAVSRGEGQRLQAAVAERDITRLRAQSIEQELDAVRVKLLEIEPAEREHTEEIITLQKERKALQTKLAQLADREEELRLMAARETELDQERQALEALLEEAGTDLTTRDDDIRRLEKSLKRASRGTPQASPRSREADLLERRLTTLYKTLEIDNRAVSDLVALKDETMKLKAEESLKRLADETENVAVRRKVGGLPPHLAIFELGFAGKGRIYYTRGKQRRFRVLAVGAKNTQKQDLEYLRKLAP